VTSHDEMRERIGAGECITFDRFQFLGSKEKKLYPRFQLVVLGRRTLQKTLFLQHLVQSGQASDFVEPPLIDTQLVGRELVLSLLPSVYRLWPKVNGNVRCVELFDVEQTEGTSNRVCLWTGSEDDLVSDGIATARRNRCSTFVVLTGNVPEKYESKLDLVDTTGVIRVERHFYNPEKSSDELMQSWRSYLDDDPKDALRLITKSICRQCGPQYSAGGCSVV